MPVEKANATILWRLVVVGGHTRSIGKTRLVCDVIRAFPKVCWIAGKITQYGHGVCAKNGENCDCAPTEHVCALAWETQPGSETDSARFLAAGAKKSFWLRTKQGYLAEGLPLLRDALTMAANELALEERPALIVEEQFADAIRKAVAVLLGDQSRQRRLQGVGANRAGSSKRVGNSRRKKRRRATRAPVDETPHEIIAREALGIAQGGGRIAATFRGAGAPNDGGSTGDSDLGVMTTLLRRSGILDVDRLLEGGDNERVMGL